MSGLSKMVTGMMPDLADVPEIAEMRETMAAVKVGIDTLITIETERLRIDTLRARRDGVIL